MDQKTVLFFGRSGSGKGTQAKLLVSHLEKSAKVIYIETGGKAREFTKETHLSGRIAKEILETGGLFPEFLPIWMWSDGLIKNYTGQEHIVLDGLCRRLTEASILDSAFKFYKIEKPTIILLDVSREWAKERLMARGRGDDAMKAIENRLSWFDGNVMESIEFFKNNPYCTFHSINGERPIEEVHKEIIEKIS